MARSRPRPQLAVDRVGAALIVRNTDEKSDAVAALAATLPGEPNWTPVVVTPMAAQQGTLPDVVAVAVNDDWRPGDGVRIILLGRVEAPDVMHRYAADLAFMSGRHVAVPLGRVTVATNGTVAVAAPAGAGGGWLVASPGGPPAYERVWWPVPAWADRLPLDTAVLTRGGACAVPVPAGFWILPADAATRRSGVVTMVPPDRHRLMVFVGGYAGSAVETMDVERLLGELAVRADPQIVLLPGAPPLIGSPRLAGSRRGDLIRAVPRLSEQGWGLATVSASGYLEWARPPEHAPVVTRKPTSTGGPAAAPWALGLRTAAGWSLLGSRQPPLGTMATNVGLVIEVETTLDGFVLRGRPAQPEEVARVIRTMVPPSRTPLVVIGHGPSPTGDGSVFAALASALDQGVIAADDAVSLTVHGVLYTAGTFVRWQPGDRTGVRLGSTLPNGQSRWASAAKTAAAPDPEPVAIDRADRDLVRRVLRGEGALDELIQGRAAATATADWLRHQPVVVGPVFTSSGEPVLPLYRPELTLIEPDFVDVRFEPHYQPEGVEFVIWSTSARLIDGPSGRHAMFAAATCFQVLDVDPLANQVFLLDLTGSSATDGHGALAERLRAEVRSNPPTPSTGPAKGASIGFNQSGQAYPVPPGIRASSERTGDPSDPLWEEQSSYRRSA